MGNLRNHCPGRVLFICYFLSLALALGSLLWVLWTCSDAIQAPMTNIKQMITIPLSPFGHSREQKRVTVLALGQRPLALAKRTAATQFVRPVCLLEPREYRG